MFSTVSHQNHLAMFIAFLYWHPYSIDILSLVTVLKMRFLQHYIIVKTRVWRAWQKKGEKKGIAGDGRERKKEKERIDYVLVCAQRIY